MFSQTKLELVPSIRVAGLLTLPCLASLILILLADIPLLFTLLLLGLQLYISYQCISKHAFLTSPNSIFSIQINTDTVYLEDKTGRRYIATLLPKSVIHPIFSLLSFDCEPIITDAKSIKSQDKYGSIYCLKPIYYFLKNRICANPRRHLFICRYNAANLSAYRRSRVWFKFS